jgi:hypothetical protein
VVKVGRSVMFDEEDLLRVVVLVQNQKGEPGGHPVRSLQQPSGPRLPSRGTWPYSGQRPANSPP